MKNLSYWDLPEELRFYKEEEREILIKYTSLIKRIDSIDRKPILLYIPGHLPKERIKKQLRSATPEPIEPRQVSFKTADYSKIIPGFQGFEAIAFKNKFVAITLEAKNDKEMHGYYAWGTINPETFEIMIPEKNLLELPVPVPVSYTHLTLPTIYSV